MLLQIFKNVVCRAVCLQTAAVAVFGGGAWKTYAAQSNIPILKVDWTTNEAVFFNWCFWMAVAGGGLTLIAGILFLVHDCYLVRRGGGSSKK
jgi:hypothetical protein